MDVTPLIRKGQQIIQGYTGGAFTVSGQSYTYPIIVYPHVTMIWNIMAHHAMDLTLDDFSQLLSNRENLDVVLLGCGESMIILPLALRQSFKTSGLFVEVMDTGAACRTYNVLMAEGRRIAAVLFPL